MYICNLRFTKTYRKERINITHLKMSSKNSICNPCIREKRTREGFVFCSDCSETLCRVCERHHKKNKESFDHKLIKIRENDLVVESLKNDDSRENSLKCQIHRSESVKYLCQNHKAFHFDRCVEDYSNRCTLQDKQELEAEMKENFMVIGEKAEKLLGHETNFCAKLEDEERNDEYCMEKVKGHIDYCFDKVKADILTELSTRRMNLMKTSLNQKEALDSLKGNIKRSSDAFERKPCRNTFLRYKEVQSSLLDCEANISKCIKGSSSLYFSLMENASCPDIYRRIERCFRITDETVEPENQFEKMPRSRPKVIPFGEKVVECEKRIALPERRTSPRYCLWLGKNIIISLQEERTLEMFDAVDGTFVSRYVCKSQPWAITRVDKVTFAVAFPYQKEITQLKVCNKFMKNKDMSIRINTSLEVSAIAYNSLYQILYAAAMNDNRIERYGVMGKEKSAIVLESTSGGIYNICYDNKTQYIFVSCHEADKVLCLNIDGMEIFEYSDPSLRKPWSVVLDDIDSVYITYSNGFDIHQINKKGELKNKIVSARRKDIIDPLGMCFNQSKSKFVIVCGNTGHMKIFKL